MDVVTSWSLGHEHRRRRAEHVLRLLRQLWGDAMPDAPDPELTVLVDALTGDDQLGGQDGWVVQGDRLGYDALAVLLQRCRTPEVVAGLLPRDLLDRVSRARGGHGPWDAAPAVPPTPVAPPVETLGVFHLDVARGRLAWDEESARLLGRLDAPRATTLAEELETWTHPADREVVVTGFQRCASTGEPHRARFRAFSAAGDVLHREATGRRVLDADGTVRVVGFLHEGAARA